MEKVANFHRTLSVSSDRDIQFGLFVLPIGIASGGDGVVIGVTHHPRESRGTIARQHHVVGLFHYLARNENRVLHALQSRNRTDLRCIGQHHTGIKFHKSIEIQHRTGARVKDRIIFKHDCGGDRSVERTAACFQNFAACGDRCRRAVYSVSIRAGTPATGATVND